jgi:signal transduction histidine kinase
VGLIFVLLAIFGVLITGSAGLALGNLTSSRQAVIDRIDPARVAGLKAAAALASQDAGVRGFVLTGQRSFLERYEMDRLDAAEALRRVEELVRGRPILVQSVQEVRRRIAAWEQGAATPAIRAAAQAEGRPDAVAVATDQDLYEGDRGGFTILEREVATARAAAQGRLNGALHLFVVVLAAGVTGFLVVVALAFALLRRWITDPIERLADDTRQVGEGGLDRPVAASGPAELAVLGRNVEAMRRRITDELAAVEAANRELDAKGDELRRSNAELEQFAYVASHDLQEPLRKVASFCQLIEKRYADQLDDRGRQYIDFAVDGAKRMQALINDLLAFSRVGRTTDRFRPVDLNQVAAAAIASLERVIDESGATVTIGPLPSVSGDATLLTAVLQNLIGNAIKFRGDDLPVVEVSAELHDDEWVLHVVDNGIGIPDRYAERIFVIFQRLHAREDYEGTGIGLALCRKIVEFHGGRIAIETGRASGTSVTFTLPVLEAAPDPVPLSVPEEAARS